MTGEPIRAYGDGAAIEYVLGSMTTAERTGFEREMAADPAIATLVRSWEEKLVPLTRRVAPTPPSPSLLPAIMARIDAAQAASKPAAAADPERGPVLPAPVVADLARLRRSRAIWRAATAGVSALAATLAIYIAAGGPVPGSAGPELVAVVNRSGELPALIVRVDPKAGIVQVRSLAAETPAGHSLELWSIVGQEPPRSLGLMSNGPARRPLRVQASRAQLEGSTLAVSVEPEGGSRTGGPTGPVVYSGKLVAEMP